MGHRPRFAGCGKYNSGYSCTKMIKFSLSRLGMFSSCLRHLRINVTSGWKFRCGGQLKYFNSGQLCRQPLPLRSLLASSNCCCSYPLKWHPVCRLIPCECSISPKDLRNTKPHIWLIACLKSVERINILHSVSSPQVTQVLWVRRTCVSPCTTEEMGLVANLHPT